MSDTNPELAPEPNPIDVVVNFRTQLRLPSRLEWIPPTVQYLTRISAALGACGPEKLGKLELALHEALTNAVVHGNLEVSSKLKELEGSAFTDTLQARTVDPAYASRTVDVVMEFDGSNSRWVILDEGPGFDVEKATAPPGEPMFDEDGDPILIPSGRGILIMRAIMDEVRYEKGGREVQLLLSTTRASGLPPVQPPEIPDDRRSHKRTAYSAQIKIIDADKDHNAFAKDISLSGIAFTSAEPIPSDEVVISLPHQEGESPISLPAKVVRQNRIGSRCFDISAQFLTTDTC